ncbi:hypothetical protein C7N43_17335 [Sphingobacteriales bacterium UPWRP_1]|nr:hypothetical protein BVG80_04065 [Sphingobacteriales bacterium TSM_CSM]PSJ75729.1 hypothetical protein C7N43_17335 [Sphingobacteriales bacterium UPWRP_1]
MRHSLIVFPVIVALFFCHALTGAEARNYALCYYLPGDSVLVKDTVKVNERLTIIINTLKITDTTSRPVVVNGQWLKKRITVTEYVALPSDTIFLDAGTGNVAPETVEQTPTSTPNITDDTPTANPVVVQPPDINNQTAILPPQTTEPGPVTEPQNTPVLTETDKTTADEPILLPTRLQNAAKKGKKDKKPAPFEPTVTQQTQNVPAVIETTAPTTPPNTGQLPPVLETEIKETAAVKETTANEPAAKPEVNLQSDADAATAGNISIEIIDNTKVIGVRTDLPDDNQPPGGTLLIQLAQPTSDNNLQPANALPPQKEMEPQPKLNAAEPPVNQNTQPKTDNPTLPPNTNYELENTPPPANNSNLSAEAPPIERVVLESKVITLGEAYQLTLEDVRKQHDAYAKAYKKAKSEEEANEILRQAGSYLENIIANDIVYYWYGTGFDKEGTSANPGSGRIACSYFVATMLTEAGLNIDRIKLAQQSAQGIIKTLSTPEHLTRCTTPAEVESLITQKGKGLYFIGFSYHVGFLYYNGSEIDLIHASPLPPGTVSRIPMKTARSFDYSNFYDIGKLTDNKGLIVNWLTGKKMPIIP